MAAMNDGAILIAGCGNMGGAMLAGWLRAGRNPATFTIVDPAMSAPPAGVRLLGAADGSSYDAVILGIKPQALSDAAPGLQTAVQGATLISMLAGTTIAALAEHFPGARAIVRVMPNLAAAIGRSPIALAGQGAAEQGDVTALMAPLGTPEWIDEAHFDAITALVGSGPAFVYRFIAALAQGGADLGLDPAQAGRLALAMVEGAAALAAGADAPPDELARRVTSAGGTTAAGLAVLDHDDALARLVAATLRAARDRGRDLAG